MSVCLALTGTLHRSAPSAVEVGTDNAYRSQASAGGEVETEPDVWDRLCRVLESSRVSDDACVECAQQRKVELTVDATLFPVQAQAIIPDILGVPVDAGLGCAQECDAETFLDSAPVIFHVIRVGS